MDPSGRRILIVDDTPDELDSMKKIFRNTGIRINTAGSEFGLYNTIEQYGKRADLILLDADLKTGDPLSIVEKLRQNHRYQDIPVVIMGEQIDRSLVERVKALKVQHLIKKPFNEEYLRRTVETVLKETD